MTDNIPIRGDLPANARKSKPKPERIVSTPARIDKGSLGRQALSAFFAEDIKEVGNYLLWDIALPSIKNAVSDIFTSGIDRLLFGGDGGPQRSKSSRAYTSYSNRTYGRRETPTERVYTQRDRREHNLESIIFATRNEAEDVLNHLISICCWGSVRHGRDLPDVYGRELGVEGPARSQGRPSPQRVYS